VINTKDKSKKIIFLRQGFGGQRKGKGKRQKAKEEGFKGCKVCKGGI
jgi:hypothetical protein